jgi:biotin-[acetyl-CoA-carboxylase] ligase BirA-like protein
MNYIYLPSIDSTQTYIKKHLESLPSPCWVCAGYQSHGVGQFDRQWESHKDENILCSLLIKDLHVQHLKDMQFKISSKIMDLLQTFNIQSHFKAPNDIYASNKKMCGILIDTKISNDMSHVIIGIGLNVNQIEFSTHIQATSMKIETNQTFVLEDVFTSIQQITHDLFLK